MTRRILLVGLAGLAGLAVVAACSQEAPAAAARICTPGNYVFCRCKDRSEGTKLCIPDGTGFDPCEGCLSGSEDNNIGEPKPAPIDDAEAPTPDATIPMVDAGPPVGERPKAGELFITEIMYDPSGNEPTDEWFEVFSIAARPVILNGIYIKDGASRSHVLGPSPAIALAPNQHMVLVRNKPAAIAAGVPAAKILAEYGTGDSDTGGILLTNSSTGALTLLDGATEIVKVSYGSFGVTQAPPGGASIQLKVPQVAFATSAASCASEASAKLACPVLPGEFPPPDCQPAGATEAQCTGGGCAIDETKCGSAATCLPLGDNRGRTVLDFRVRRLNIAAPDSLAALAFATKVTIPTVDLKSAECGEHGTDSWAWLMRLDREKKTLTTGGAPPTTDPFALGYCFYNSLHDGKPIAPTADIPVRLDQNGTVFSSGGTAKLTMPLFVGADQSSLVLLPITDFAVRNVTISAEDNCIGSFNGKALDGTCLEDPAKCAKWRTAGAMAGYITLEEADGVDVSAFKQSLCALLTKSPTPKCPRDAAGKITLQGDYCGATRSACGCRDSFWVAATFAASAVRINDGSGIAACGSP